MTFPKAKDLRIVSVGGHEFIGQVTDTGMQKAVDFDKEKLPTYVKLMNTGESMILSFSISEAVVRSLDQEEQTRYDYCLDFMKQAKAVALATVENEVFDELIAKR